MFSIVFDQVSLCQEYNKTYIIDEVKNCKVNAWEFYYNETVESPEGSNEDDFYSDASNLDSDESNDEDNDSD